MTRFYTELEKTFPGLVRRFVVGKSAEGKDVEGLRLHKFVNTTDEDEGEGVWSGRTMMGRRKGRAEEVKTRVFYLQGGQHAREVSSRSRLPFLSTDMLKKKRPPGRSGSHPHPSFTLHTISSSKPLS